MGKYNSRKRKTKKNIPAGIAHIHSTFNNTIVTITDLEGNVVSWASSGKQGVKGSKKSTPFAAGMAAEAAGREATAAGMKTVNVKVKGLVHKNKVDREKSRLTKKVNTMEVK